MSENSAPEPLIHRAVARQAALRPDATALLDQGRPITYETLDQAASRYAAEFAAIGVGPGQVVPTLLPRSAQLVALQLAVLKCGAAYAGLDHRWPPDRVNVILEQVSPGLVVTREPALAGRFRAYQPPAEDLGQAATMARNRAEDLAPAAISGASPATVFFTSGTTGVPKGVVCPHQAVTRLFRPGGLAGFGPGHATPQAAPLPWDMYAFELWGQLTSGGSTVLVEADHLLPSSLRELVRTAGVDTLWITTSLFNLFVDEDPACFDGLRQVLTGGEKLSPGHVRSFLRQHPGIPLHNGYGPAENCMLTTTHLLALEDCDNPGGVPVGRPVAGTIVLVLDEHDQPCPAAEPGEICIAGKGLATSYLSDPKLTAEKFPTVNFDGTALRVYRTGDIGCFDGAGVLHFRGRRDRQIKISGYRVELLEIEVTARGLAGVRDCAALALAGPDGQVDKLALFYLAELSQPAGPAEPAAVRERLTSLLPGYAVPAVVRCLERFPVTANGKLDRDELARIARTPQRAPRPPVSAGQSAKSDWLPFGSKPDAAIRLLCLPHAGAGATVYRAWAAGLASWIGGCPVQPPGREKRRREQPFDSVGPLVESLARAVAASVNPPYAIFGHSTGALCSFELIRELRRIGGPEPVHLFIAGRRAPQLPMPRTNLLGLSTDELAAALRRLGGTPEQVLADHAVLAMIQPMLIADFSVNECYVYTPQAALATPITAFAATSDAGADVDQVAAWKEQTSAEFRLHALAGGHFAVFDRAPEVMTVIADTLKHWS